jgi:HEAT repeat protein
MARQESCEAISAYPNAASLHEVHLIALAQLGEEQAMLKAWDRYAALFPDKALNRDLLEKMAWGVLQKAKGASSLTVRLASLIAAYFSQDARGVAILQQGMRESNVILRAAAVELAGHFRDEKLKTEMKRLWQEERVWIVKQKVIQSIGKMKMTEWRSSLESLIASDQALAEEKAAAIQAWVHLSEDLRREDIVRLVASNRMGLRLLACQLIAHFQSLRDSDQLLVLATDSHENVRSAALQALGILRPHEKIVIPAIEKYVLDKSPKVAITASWVLMLYDRVKGQGALEPYLLHPRREIRLLAAAALNAAGRYGVDLAVRHVTTSSDPYVRLNLALGLIGQREAVDKALDILYLGVTENRDRWIWKDEGLFRCLTPRGKKEMENPTVTPEMENQLARLEVLNVLCFLKHPHAQEAIRKNLLERTWGLSGVASALLLTEGDEAAVDLVRHLLEDENSKIRVQAALILSLWSREEEAIKVLEENYWEANRELKERILEGIGRIGSITSIPFLLEVLKEPSQTLRIIAATALIQCLNH